MAEITQYQSNSIQELMTNLNQYKYNPSTIQRTILDFLDEITEGQVDIVDPTNPFVFLLESSSVNTALAVNENLINLRKQYASLAQTEEDLYFHMSDKDYLNRFATPSETDFTVVINVNDMYSRMVRDEGEKCYKVTIPRDTEFKIDGLVFTSQYPINIRRYDNGVVQISFDSTILSPLETLRSNIIDYIVRRDNDQVDWIFFKIRVKQLAIATTYFPLQKSVMFSENLTFLDQFHSFRAFYRNNATNNKWVEMLTTHTDQVFDPYKPTAVGKVTTGQINVTIPLIYLTNQLISGEVRFDVYTTKGNHTINLANYKFDSFSAVFRAIDEERDLNDYTNAAMTMSYYVYSDQMVSGGTDGIDFETLRERVIFNSIGSQQLPITNVQLEAHVNNKGFDLVKNIDVLTNRIFSATQKLPMPLNPRLITPASIGISTFITNIPYLKTLPGSRDNVDRLTILSSNLYQNDNGILRILPPEEIESIKAMSKVTQVNLINSRHYLYSPFYYVLDNTQHGFEVRAYNLDYPAASNLSFKSQNQTLQLPVNTGSYTFEKTSKGYKLSITTKSGNFYKQLADGLVAVQLAYYPVGENDLAYINGVLREKTQDGERIFDFEIETNYDLDGNNHLCITNGKMFGNELIETWVDLTSEFHLLHTTNSITDGFIPDATEAMIGKFLLTEGSSGNTHETLSLQFGTSLKNLWTRSRSFATGYNYQRHDVDVPLTYDEDIYAIDPVTSSIFTVDAQGNLVYNLLHRRGDIVLDEQGNTVYKFRAGDVVLDENGKPVVVSTLSVDKELDMLFVDGKYYFADDLAFQNYRHELVAVLDTWITEDLSNVQDILLEQTKIYFYPKTTLGQVKIFTENGGHDFIPAEQSLKVDLYVRPDIYSDSTIRLNLMEKTIKLLDSYIGGKTVNMTEIINELNKIYGDSVLSFTVSGLGGSKDYRIVKIDGEHNRLCLKKILYIQQDNTIIIKEDVEVNFQRMDI